ncbi:hypothetical protein ISF_03189 [Cordyceps fumosorosea ARSEF 2679]|uniref:Clr5 domain-containing protein n=1 Tax=Cordyceps fumosorosea (strain ARSEF 2679) TaxID=1081104 RepID=A0A162LCW7_CORFA|nr:hypothetical protein ISF_03189 [Cordyceps fumosorosea ARSEF 2679]OAA68814.1 hypothetical protein ISF_03189 [Cordyceps fumosorosea ARSEF 2679]
MLCPPLHSREGPFFCSKRAFQTQFRRWNFPAKQRPAHKNDRLVARIKELWEKNLSQREMLRILNEEDGYDIKPRELVRVRTKNRWLLRVPNATTDAPPEVPHDGDEDDDDVDDDGTDDDNDSAAAAVINGGSDMIMQDSDSGNGAPTVPAAGRRARRRGRQGGQDAQSTTVGSNNRFPSEMTIDEARDILSLDTATYRTLRTNFQQICHEDSLSRKTEAGPERWAAAKQRLVGSSPALQRMLWAGAGGTGTHGSSSSSSLNQRQLALDVICTDVTKRLRTLETRMTLGAAKAVLGVNPAESRDMRAALHAVLSEARLASKSDATPQQWEGLKRQWARRSPRVRGVLGDDSGTEEARARLRALETVASDVMKRLRDQRRSRQSLAAAAGGQEGARPGSGGAATAADSSSPSTTTSIAAGAAHDHHQIEMSESSLASSAFDDLSEVSQMAFGSPGSDAMQHMSAAMQLDSSGMSPHALLLSPGNPTAAAAAAAAAAFMGHHHHPSPQAFYDVGAVASSPSAGAASGYQQTTTTPRGGAACAVYLRLHPSSSFLTGAGLWVATLGAHPSVQELREAAVARFPGAACGRVEGVIKDGKGGELPLQIEQEQELAAYLAHTQGASPTFNVQLVWKGT